MTEPSTPKEPQKVNNSSLSALGIILNGYCVSKATRGEDGKRRYILDIFAPPTKTALSVTVDQSMYDSVNPCDMTTILRLPVTLEVFNGRLYAKLV